MIQIRCRFNDEGEYSRLVDMAAALGLQAGKIQRKDFYSLCWFKTAKTAKMTDDDAKKGE